MSDLTDRMRTCAAAIMSRNEAGNHEGVVLVARAAVDLLIEASNVIEAIPPPLGEPMAIIEPPPKPEQNSLLPTHHGLAAQTAPADALAQPRQVPRAVWTTGFDTLPPAAAGGNGPPRPRAPRVCPNCDSRAAKRVQREGSKLMLVCPVCAHTWPYRA